MTQPSRTRDRDRGLQGGTREVLLRAPRVLVAARASEILVQSSFSDVCRQSGLWPAMVGKPVGEVVAIPGGSQARTSGRGPMGIAWSPAQSTPWPGALQGSPLPREASTGVQRRFPPSSALLCLRGQTRPLSGVSLHFVRRVLHRIFKLFYQFFSFAVFMSERPEGLVFTVESSGSVPECLLQVREESHTGSVWGPAFVDGSSGFLFLWCVFALVSVSASSSAW